MTPWEIIYLVLWLAGSFLVASLLEKKFPLFRKPVGVLALFGCFLTALLLHNLIFAVFQLEEPVFFLIAVFSFGVFALLLFCQMSKKVEEVIKIKEKKRDKNSRVDKDVYRSVFSCCWYGLFT